jgi:hypothetical protein
MLAATAISLMSGGVDVFAEGAPVVSVESDLYGTANTNGYTTLKAEEEENEVTYDDTTAAIITLSFKDGSEIDDSLIDTSNAYITLDEGDGYYLDDLTFNGGDLDSVFEDGKLIYHLEMGDIEWNQPEGYEVDNGGVEWSCQGGNGNGEYVFNLSVHGITYDGVELDPASFRATVYIYGREFSATSSPENPSSARWGAGGYDSVELPLPEEKALEEEVVVDTEPVWTWVGDDTYGKPIICDYSHEEQQQMMGGSQGGSDEKKDENDEQNGPDDEQEGGSQDQQGENDNEAANYHDATDNFYISWPEGVDASALENGDVTITLYSKYGDEYVLTPNTGLKVVEQNGEEIADGEYSVFASSDTTQIAVNMVYWAYTPVYTTMTIDVNTDKISGYDGEVSYSTEIGSVYTYMVQTGGGLDYYGTVTAQGLYGIANMDDLELADFSGHATSYDYAYQEGEGMQKNAVAFLIDNGDGTYTVTENEDEATKYDADNAAALVGHFLLTTNRDESIEAEYNGEMVEFSKNYDGNTMVNIPDLETTRLVAADGYVLSQAMIWSEHMRWPWLYFNGCGWLASDAE